MKPAIGIHRIATACIRGALAACLMAAVPAPAAEQGDARKALDEVVERLNALDRWLDDAQKQRSRWERDLREKDREVAAVAAKVEEAAAALAAVEEALTRMKREQAELEALREDQAQRIGAHLAASYRMSGQDFVKLILNQESPDTFERMARYHRYFSQARLDALADYRATLDKLAGNRFKLETRRDEQRSRQEELAEREQALIRERESRKALIRELDEQVEDKASERKRLDADRSRLEQLIAELSRRATELDGSAFEARKGRLPWPMKGRVTNAFGNSRADGRLTWHGMVIAAEEGTAVQAVFRGRVVFANWLRGFGLLTIIDHGGGYMTLYGHADVLLKTVGDWAEGGETIARAGRSGGQRTSGLYFEVRQKGVARDPIGWLQRR